MENDVSKLNSSLALVEMEEQINETEFKVIVNPRYLTLSNASFIEQPLNEVVKIKGSITVSF